MKEQTIEIIKYDGPYYVREMQLRAVDEVMSQFDFAWVKKTIDETNTKWFSDELGALEVPSIEDIKVAARGALYHAATSDDVKSLVIKKNFQAVKDGDKLRLAYIISDLEVKLAQLY